MAGRRVNHALRVHRQRRLRPVLHEDVEKAKDSEQRQLSEVGQLTGRSADVKFCSAENLDNLQFLDSVK